jgi:glycosyltransferase involved in cell wall biosynthesis
VKVLFYHLVPFALAHGGLQTQILRSREALQQLGVEVDFLRWYEGSQPADVLHFFGRIPLPLLQLARQKGMKIVVADLLTEQGSRSPFRIRFQKTVMRTMEKALPGMSNEIFNWKSYRLADACVALTSWEAQLMTELFAAPPEKLHVIPNGVEEVFLQSRPVTRGPWLICTATITERKRVLELAQAAVHAQTPLWVIGKAYADSDPYAKRFFQLAAQHPKILRFEGPITDRAKMANAYREARGFVLLSAMESLSLSAFEAAACECSLLLSDLPWARTVFKESVSYCPVTSAVAPTAATLRSFYEAAPTLKPPAKPPTWTDVARQLKSLYEGLLKTSR